MGVTSGFIPTNIIGSLSLYLVTKQACLGVISRKIMASKVESCLYLVFWSSWLKSLDLRPQLCEPLAGSPNTGMQDPVFSIVCLKVLLVGLLLLCAVDGSVLPIREVTPSISLPPPQKKNPGCLHVQTMKLEGWATYRR